LAACELLGPWRGRGDVTWSARTTCFGSSLSLEDAESFVSQLCGPEGSPLPLKGPRRHVNHPVDLRLHLHVHAETPGSKNDPLALKYFYFGRQVQVPS